MDNPDNKEIFAENIRSLQRQNEEAVGKLLAQLGKEGPPRQFSLYDSVQQYPLMHRRKSATVRWRMKWTQYLLGRW